MTNFTELIPVPSDRLVPVADPLRLAMAAYLARFKGSSRQHTESDLRCYLTWCAERGLDPLAVRRPHLELYIRWMQEIRRFKPSTVSRRFSVAWRGAASCLCQPPVQIAQGLSPAEVSCGRSAGSGERTVGIEAHVRVAFGAHVRGGKVPRKRISGQASEVWGGRVVVAGERPADRSSLPWRHLR
jgi:hypothetical protein